LMHAQSRPQSASAVVALRFLTLLDKDAFGEV